ncbi:uncharacterized protein LOC134840563 [Symsagittifera roscoffensis]|uniref:uncharacterized protein LOC134840563 n=1 Tax=Symsagittifera roscoffensis TaxID=84072 RepID=UPI00307C2950
MFECASISVIFLLVSLGVFGSLSILTIIFMCPDIRNRKTFIATSTSFHELIYATVIVICVVITEIEQSNYHWFFPCRVRYLLVAGSCDLFHVTIMALDRYYFMNSPLSYEFKAPSWIEFGLPCTWVSSYIVLAYMAEGTCKFEFEAVAKAIEVL